MYVRNLYPMFYYSFFSCIPFMCVWVLRGLMILSKWFIYVYNMRNYMNNVNDVSHARLIVTKSSRTSRKTHQISHQTFISLFYFGSSVNHTIVCVMVVNRELILNCSQPILVLIVQWKYLTVSNVNSRTARVCEKFNAMT